MRLIVDANYYVLCEHVIVYCICAILNAVVWLDLYRKLATVLCIYCTVFSVIGTIRTMELLFFFGISAAYTHCVHV